MFLRWTGQFTAPGGAEGLGVAKAGVFLVCCTQSRAVLLPAPPSPGQLKSDSDLTTARQQKCKTEMRDYTKANKDMHQSVVT